MGAHQPRGIRAGRKLKTHRREQRWKSIKYSKANTVATMKAKPLGSASMAKGIVLEKMCVRRRPPPPPPPPPPRCRLAARARACRASARCGRRACGRRTPAPRQPPRCRHGRTTTFRALPCI